jgi:hypothetical protein
MEIEAKNRLDAALNSAEPEENLIKVSKEMKQEGLSQLEIYELFTGYLPLLTEPNLDDKEAAVWGALEVIYGWCVEGRQLFPHILSNEEIEKYRESKKLN